MGGRMGGKRETQRERESYEEEGGGMLREKERERERMGGERE